MKSPLIGLLSVAWCAPGSSPLCGGLAVPAGEGPGATAVIAPCTAHVTAPLTVPVVAPARASRAVVTACPMAAPAFLATACLPARAFVRVPLACFAPAPVARTFLASPCRTPLASGRFFAEGFFPLEGPPRALDALPREPPALSSFRSTRRHGHFLLRRVEPVRHGAAGTRTRRPSLFASAGTSPATAHSPVVLGRRPRRGTDDTRRRAGGSALCDLPCGIDDRVTEFRQEAPVVEVPPRVEIAPMVGGNRAPSTSQHPATSEDKAQKVPPRVTTSAVRPGTSACTAVETSGTRSSTHRQGTDCAAASHPVAEGSGLRLSVHHCPMPTSAWAWIADRLGVGRGRAAPRGLSLFVRLGQLPGGIVTSWTGSALGRQCITLFRPAGSSKACGRRCGGCFSSTTTSR